jgi:hypothetical protein
VYSRFTSHRCKRLKKDCMPSTSIRNNKIRKPPISRTAQLEEKVDGPFSLLRSQENFADRQPGASSGSSVLFAPPTQVGIPTPRSNFNLSPSSIYEDVSIYKIPDPLAEESLNTFRRAFLPFFPFVQIPTALSACDLRLQKPFLWLVIMSLTTKSASRQLAMGDTIRRIVSSKVVAEHEKSLDILLGLICYLAWSVASIVPGRSYLTDTTQGSTITRSTNHILVMWTQLAIALIFELGIHKACSGDAGQISSQADWNPPRPLMGTTRSIEERRAILGVFIISSMRVLLIFPPTRCN